MQSAFPSSLHPRWGGYLSLLVSAIRDVLQGHHKRGFLIRVLQQLPAARRQRLDVRCWDRVGWWGEELCGESCVGVEGVDID